MDSSSEIQITLIREEHWRKAEAVRLALRTPRQLAQALGITDKQMTQILIGVECRYCGNVPGQRCTTVTGNPSPPHISRMLNFLAVSYAALHPGDLVIHEEDHIEDLI